jgi:AcrR family transcriptional regulator
MKNRERTETRKNEIIDTAQRLFMEQGYEETSIGDILAESGLAKGSLYYHYRSKEEILDGVILRITEALTVAAKNVADDPALTACEKMPRLIASINISNSSGESMIRELHKPANALLHQKSLARTIRAVAPILANVVEQGIREGVYRTPYPLETMELLLTAAQFIFDEGIFQWSPEERAARMTAFIDLMENALGAAKGSFQFLAGQA